MKKVTSSASSQRSDGVFLFRRDRATTRKKKKNQKPKVIANSKPRVTELNVTEAAGVPEVGEPRRLCQQRDACIRASSMVKPQPPDSPESRSQPEDLSVSSSQQRSREDRERRPLSGKPPELKLSVRKLLGCSPSPPRSPTSRAGSCSPADVDVEAARQSPAPVGSPHEDAARGEL